MSNDIDNFKEIAKKLGLKSYDPLKEGLYDLTEYFVIRNDNVKDLDPEPIGETFLATSDKPDIIRNDCVYKGLPLEQKYSIIYADPCWSYRDKMNAGNRGAAFKYNTEGEEWIGNMPVKEMVEDDAILFMWVTFPKLWEIAASGVMQKWGFEYKTIGFVWVKRNAKSDSLAIGGGSYTRSNAEICLIGKRGKGLKREDASIRSILMDRRGAHSEKPEEARRRIRKLYGKQKRLELFARTASEGFDAWGNEVGKL
ncbi:MAG: hypothetical protein CL489_16590 [Acidobacteria bacterium]|nr:hypothetical protein [Acidobacteriota bacterium]|tara:strand:- start:543 stop:1304 length:762 start_codon:yes stop_codon:yes gene_type:complete